MRQIRRWQQVQLIYMPGAVVPSFSTNDHDADENDTGETPENIPLVLPSEVESTRRRAVCLHQVAEYERQLRLAQLQDSLVELRRVRRIRHTLSVNHRTQIAGQGQCASTRSRTVVSSVDERIVKCVQRYRAAYSALLQLDPTGTWQETYLELKDEDNRGPGKEDHEQALGDGSYTFSWIWLLNPRARDVGGSEVDHGECGASEEEVNDVMRVQWTTSQARMERWVEEVELLQEEMRRVVMFLEWKSETWFARKDVRLTTASPSIQSGLQAYALKQAAIYHNLAVSFSKLWRPTLVSYDLEHTWITGYMKKHGISFSDVNTPTSRARGVFKARVRDQTDEGSSQVDTTSHIWLRDSFDVTADDNTTLLEEAVYTEDDDEDEGNYSGTWDTPYHSDSGADGDDGDDSDDDGDDSDDFDYDFD